jgi:soluble lytic murein transglycosylase
MIVRAAVALAILVIAPAGIPSASAEARRLVDGDGVVHFTNVPGDPRYRGLPGASATTSASDRPWVLYATEIHEISRQHDVDPALVQAVIRVESAFNPSAVSPKGAGGLMQLMPRTASALGVFDRFDPRENIRGGVRHLRYLLDRYRGNVTMAIAAYNAGEGAVDFHRGIPPYPETEQYVQRVLRQADGSEARGGSRQGIYRYPGPDDTLIYSNLPPGIRRPVTTSTRGH